MQLLVIIYLIYKYTFMYFEKVKEKEKKLLFL